ncbi:phenylalanyl-tRNA synthetase beta chain [Methanococcus maripaludis]|uniref:Phenylalanine--tRNA ligase beta subunit n=1 Tax=Methanococcus maripaludis TaxID=39152 RepID=A0A7J9P3H7_METMI|nr:phenylalanyl-tRNA synthetase beta chain [Methanococcus maripaludis]
MPTINVNKVDLERLSNISLSDKLIEDRFPMMGVEVEEIFEEVDKNGKKQNMVQFSINPDRPDYLSVEGLARGFRGFMGITTGIQEFEVLDSDIKVTVEENETRPYVAFALVKNVLMDEFVLESMINLQEKLHWAIGRDRKKLAIGIHDFDKVKAPFTYKEIKGDEIKFVPLGYEDEEMTPREIIEKHEKGIKYAHLIQNDKFPIIVDANGEVLSLPPIINGTLTKVTPTSKNLLIDITGTEKEAVEETLNIIVCALAERRGTIVSVNVNGKKYPDLTPKSRMISVESINKKLGLNLNPGEIIQALKKSGMNALYEDGNLIVKIPAYRNDILQNVDLKEEIAINYGYEKFDGKLPSVATTGSKDPVEKKCSAMSDLMIGLGFYEVMNLTLSNQDTLFEKMNLKVDEKDYIEVLKPASIEHRVLRTSILPLLLETLYINKHNALPQKIFEVGDCVVIDEEDTETDTKCKNIKKIAGAITHPLTNFNEIKSSTEALLREFFEGFEFENYEHPAFIPGRCAKILKSGKEVGFFGEIHPEVILNFELEHPVVGFEITIE